MAVRRRAWLAHMRRVKMNWMLLCGKRRLVDCGPARVPTNRVCNFGFCVMLSACETNFAKK